MDDRDDQWVTMAMADDTLVADLLLLLRKPSLPLQWTVRQRRSRWNEKKTESTRASPTTPLSWTAATSIDGYEGSTRPTRALDASGSKAVDHGETATAKRSRKKRTLAELQQEEKLLLKEKKILKNELSSLHLTIEKQKAKNQSLKRIKLDLMSQQTFKTGNAVLGPTQFEEVHCHPSKLVSAQTVQDRVVDDELPVCAASGSSKKQEISNHECSFLLPDLNIPVGEDFYSNDIPELS
ncbi:hypothetical protein VNO77_06222 [Canavalia gladiata]|uniref:Uncharacterized protein n=1 Tax=Canavalia gladiata TaxID=3824 RepID=A0AAN9MD28_CANGL